MFASTPDLAHPARSGEATGSTAPRSGFAYLVRATNTQRANPFIWQQLIPTRRPAYPPCRTGCALSSGRGRKAGPVICCFLPLPVNSFPALLLLLPSFLLALFVATPATDSCRAIVVNATTERETAPCTAVIRHVPPLGFAPRAIRHVSLWSRARGVI